MEKDRLKAQKTLLYSVLLSSLGPIVLGIGLLFGRSSTQIADFVRRTTELIAVTISWLLFLKTSRNIDEKSKKKLENLANISVGFAMILSGATMLLVLIISKDKVKGNVIIPLTISILGFITNSWLWRRYMKHNREKANSIISAQSKLYAAKSFVDVAVSVALLSLVISSNSNFSSYMDIIGSVIVAVYLVLNGALVIKNINKADDI